MSKNKKNIPAQNINKNLENISDSIKQGNSELEQIRSNTEEIKNSTKSPVPIIVTIILGIGAIAAAIWGPLYSVRHSGDNQISDETMITESSSIAEPAYELYLYSEYRKITIYQETNMTATLNFDTDNVKITAYLESGKEDTLEMSRKNAEEWEVKVIFNEVGTHKVVAEAVAPDGKKMEYSTEVEVIPISVDINVFDQFFGQ